MAAEFSVEGIEQGLAVGLLKGDPADVGGVGIPSEEAAGGNVYPEVCGGGIGIGVAIGGGAIAKGDPAKVRGVGKAG